jgi:hypothetical protein
MTNNDLAYFLKNRMYLIDINKKFNDIIFTVEEQFKNYEIIMNSVSLECSCDKFKNNMLVCKHIKFILEKIDQAKSIRSRSYGELTSSKIFYIEIKKNLDPDLFKSNRNPRFNEYKLLEDVDYSGNCYICLQKLNNKIIRCKHCSRYYHETVFMVG